MVLKKFAQGDIANWLVLLTLLIQIIMLTTLTQRMTHLEGLLFSTSTPEIMDRIPDEQGHILGDVNAPVTVVEFADFQCPYCASAELIVKQILSQYPDKIRFLYRHFPITTTHPYAMDAAIASECANDQNAFWEMHDLIYIRQSEFEKDGFSSQEFFSKIAIATGINNIEFEKCTNSYSFNDYVAQDISDGLRYGVSGTPTFFVNREKVIGISKLETTILHELAKLSK